MIPTEWKMAKVIPIHKSGTRSNFDNYRPISILPAISKIFEKIIHRQVMTFLDKNQLLSQFQFGFRRGLSTEYAASILLDDIRRNVDKGNLVGAVFVDLSKAFDTISHAMLLDKLPQYGIRDGELEWFKDYLFPRKSIVSYDGRLSEEQKSFTGVPQGSILGPLLFLISFNDVVDVIEHSNIVKYAHDTVLYAADKNIQTIQTDLSKDMDNMMDWLKENELVINLKKGKTESLLFGTAQRIAKQNEQFKVLISRPSPTVIENTKEYKYLGIHVDSSLNLNSNFEKCYKRVTGRLRLLAKLRSYVDQATASTIYRTMIIPSFTYCGILQLKITQTQINKLLSFHDRSLKVVFTEDESSKELTSVINANQLRACKLVGKCLNKDICDLFKNYFILQDHEKQTRNNQYVLKLPIIKTEYARKSFYFMGAKIYNELPLEIRKIKNNNDFEKQLTEHFK